MKFNTSKLILSISIIALASCVSTPVTVTGPDGTPHQLVSCNAVESCYEYAAEACGGKYDIVHTTNEVSGDSISTSSRTKMLIKCKK